ncbi:hypothetical protein JCM8202v2_005318 [Rhodotorula sphaerocarpa]
MYSEDAAPDSAIPPPRDDRREWTIDSKTAFTDPPVFPRGGAAAKRPRRQGPFPVPVLSSEERAARRALRKTGRSPEHHLPLHATKAEQRKRAWLERQAFEEERERLLRMLSTNGRDDLSGDALEYLEVADVPVLNALSALHLRTSIPAAREAGLYYLQLSLGLDEAQPKEANTLAVLLEASDPEAALHWHRVAVRHAPDEPEFVLDLGNALRSQGQSHAAASAFGELVRQFPGTPYEAFGWYKLARLFEEADWPEDREGAGPSFLSAYDALQRLGQVPPADRVGPRWDDLAGLEESAIYGVAMYHGGDCLELPRAFSHREQLDSGHASSEKEGVPQSPSSRSRSRRSHAAVIVDPSLQRTLDLVLHSLQDLSRSPSAAARATSIRDLATQVESAFARLQRAEKHEGARQEELFRVLEEVRRELAGLPERVSAARKLRDARPPGVSPVFPAADPLERIMKRVERARRLST